MTSEIELFGKDSVKLNILKELIGGDINISLSLDGGVYQDYLSQIHQDGSRMQVLGKFNLSEDPMGEVLTIRPIMVSSMLKVTFGFSGLALSSEKKLSVFRSATKTIERKYDINDMLSSVEFIPQGNVKYLLRLTYGESESEEPAASVPVPESPAPAQEASSAVVPAIDESLDDFEMFSSSEATPVQPEPNPKTAPRLRNVPKPESNAVSEQHSAAESSENAAEVDSLQEEIKAAEEKKKKLAERRESAKDLLNKLEAEYEKDYEEFKKELEEYKQQFGVDQSVIEYYKDNDIQPIEDLIKEISEKIAQAEQQISLVILGRQKKTMEIENEVKSNKR